MNLKSANRIHAVGFQFTKNNTSRKCFLIFVKFAEMNECEYDVWWTINAINRIYKGDEGNSTAGAPEMRSN